MRRRAVLPASLLMAVAVTVGSSARAQEAPGGKVVILDTSGFWRMHHAMAMPVIRYPDGVRSVAPAGAEADAWKAVVAKPTSLPQPGWTEVEFDDSTWYRGPAASACRTPYLARLSMRGRFTVNDPRKAQGLVLSLDYHGGAVVCLNGKELLRQRVPAGASGDDALAEDYPPEAFVDADGKLIALRGNEPLLKKDSLPEETLRRIAGRKRSLRVDVPAQQLRAGMNVLSIELFRSPYHPVLDDHKVTQEYKSTALTHDMSWNTCELLGARLTAPSAEAVVPDAARPAGLQVWNSDPLATDFDLDFGSRAEPLGPIRLVGARNGSYSGKVVVGSTQPIRALKAVAGELAGPDGSRIAASQVRVRYALPWDVCRTTNEGNLETVPYPAPPAPLFALSETPPAEAPVAEKKPPAKVGAADLTRIARYGLEPFVLDAPGQPAPAFGAVVPVWVTVTVPRDAKPGRYAGSLAIQAGGAKIAEVPVELTVADWTLPDPRDYWTWVDLVQSPDVLALEYNVPLWSDRHFELIARSMKLLGEAGNRVLYVPLIAQTNLGNEQSMVRWIRRGPDAYEHDFSILERYLDTAIQHMGKPQAVVLNVWDLYLYRTGAKAYAYVGSQAMQSSTRTADKGPLVTVVDSASGKAEAVELSAELDAAAQAMWKPLFNGLRQRMEQRGLQKAMMLGMITDAWVSKEQVEFWQRAGADLPWVSASHARHDAAKAIYGLADVGYQAHAFGADFGYAASLRGWSRPSLNALYERWGGFPLTMLTRWRHFPEYSVTGNTRGVGRVGGDFWPAVKDKSGQRKGLVWERYPQASWRQLSLLTSVLAPGPQGAVATARFEALREGLQDAEARILLERALSDKALAERLGPELVKRCQDAIAERHQAMWLSVSALQVGPRSQHAFAAWRGCYYAGVTGYRWFLGSGWQERCRTLYTLAGQVAAKLPG